MNRPLVAVTACALFVLGACGPASPNGGGTPGSSGVSETPGQTSAGASSGASAPAASVAGGTAQVDLVFTGSRPFTAKGTAGRCIRAASGGVLQFFGFDATEADYPRMGLSFSIAEMNDR